MAGIGLSRLLQGTVEGIDKGMARRETDKANQRRDVAWDQGQEDRKYRLDRREVTDQRADTAYGQGQEDRSSKLTRDKTVQGREDTKWNRENDKALRFEAGNDALRSLLSTGDPSESVAYLNKYAGGKYDAQRMPDGNYKVSVSIEGKPSQSKIVSQDEIGTFMQRIMAADVGKEVKSQAKEDRTDARKQKDYDFQLEKMREEYRLKREVESVKQKGKGGKGYRTSGGTRDNYTTREIISISNGLDKRGKEGYGTVYGDKWSFDTQRARAIASSFSMLSEAHFFNVSNKDPKMNASSNYSLRKMRSYLNRAIKIVDGEGMSKSDPGYDNRIADVIESQVDFDLRNMISESSPALNREGNTGGNRSGAGGWSPGDPIPMDAINELKQYRDDPEARAGFDSIFGKGSADDILKGNVSGNNVQDSQSRNDTSGIMDAAASTTEAPKPKRKTKSDSKERRAAIARKRKSAKDQRAIAKSEYSNEWKNFSDDEKVKWLKENGRALKAKSESSWKKADKEVRHIRSAKRAKNSSKSAYEKGKKDFKLSRES